MSCFSFSRYTILLAAAASSVSADIFDTTLPDGFFPGQNTGIGSWYRASNGGDSTNGNSWCGYPYSDSDPVFAPSLNAMGGGTYDSNPDQWRASTQGHCGLEANVTDPDTGASMLMYIGDAFDDTWVRTPASIDIMIDGFTSLNGDPNGDKNTVIKDVNWELTGRVNTQYAAPGASWPNSG